MIPMSHRLRIFKTSASGIPLKDLWKLRLTVIVEAPQRLKGERDANREVPGGFSNTPNLCTILFRMLH